MMKRVFAPGCALMIYKPELAQRMLDFLNQDLGNIAEHLTCCRHEPGLAEGTQIINTCAGCDRRYRELYNQISTLSLWEVLAEKDTFPFPDYQGQKMAILDACPTRDQVRVHQAIRALLKRMNIDLVEPAKTGTKSTCCGDSFFGVLPVEQVKEQMKKRAAEMPVNDVVVYCVSCCKSLHIGGKKPRYLIDLLFGEETLPKTFEPEEWHHELDEFIQSH
jgi:Fe-S oxidoreductase